MALNDEMVRTGNNDVYFASSIQIYKIRASDQLIEHVAGTADFKDGDQGETALKARFRNIVAFHVRQIDSTNIELYIIDSDRIRKIFSNGTVVTICGSTSGFEGDGGLAINAKLSNPKDLFVWKEELFILDYGNNRIRKISKDGIISTIAGTGERGSTFSGTRPARETPIGPESFSCSRTGIIYIKCFKDVLSFEIRSGNITFLFKRNILETIRVVTLPSGIDELYFSDGVYILRRDEFGNITTIAGCESRDITNSTMDGYMANQVYISVQKFFIRLNQQGNVEFYFGDDKLIRKVDEKGKIWTIFGSRDGTIEFFSIPATYSITLSPTDATVTENGDILFYDNNVNLRKMKRDGQLEIVSAPSINFGRCTNGDKISFDGFSFVTHTNIAVSGNKIYTILKKTNNSPKGTAADSLIKISDNQVCLLYGLPKYQANQTATTSILNDPRGIFVESGVIYFSDSLGHRVLKIEKDRIITIAGNSIAGYSGDGNLAINAMMNRPTALFVDAKQNIYIADSGNHRIRMINSENGIITTVAGNGIQGYSSANVLATNTSLNQPKGVFVNSKGEIYISDTGNNRIRKIDTNGFISTIAGTGYSGSTVNSNPLLCDLNGPSTIQEYSNTLYFADTNNHVIRKFGYNNRLETVVGQLGVGGIGGGGIDSSLLYYPEGFHVFKAYSTFITDTANNRIARLEFSNLNTKLRDYTRPTSIFCISDYGFEYYFTSNDKIYYVNTYSFGGIKVIAGGVGDDATVEYSKLSLNGLHATRDYIYVADASNNRIRRISIETGMITTVAGSGDYGYSGDNGLALLAKLASPENVFVTERGDIYISDTGNYRIRRVDSQTGIITTIAGNGLQGYSEDNQLAITSRIDSPTRIYVSSNSEVFFLQKETSDYSTEIAKTKLTKISKNGMLSILPFSSVTSISGFSNSGDLVIISESTIYKLSLSCPENFTLSVDFTTCVPTCGGISSENGTACSSLGSCIAPNTCICKEHYNGTYCELAICTQGCVFGTCTKPNHCECEKGYYGVNCSLNDNIWIISISVVISVFSLLMITLILTTVSCILYKRYRKEKIILQTDSSLSSKLLTGFETEMESPSIRSQSSTYSTLFIPLEQLDLNKPIKRLGGGAFGFVLQCYWNTTIVAVKVFDLNNMNISEEDFTLEAGVLSSLRHPNIINFFGVSFSPTKRYIVMECLEQSLDKVIADLNIGLIRKSLPEKVRILLDVTKGINYLHTLENKIIHRDLKPANILLDKNGICKLCDFGLSRALSKNTFSALTHNLGTQHYWAPETQFDDQISRSEATAIDVFSFSIIMYQLLMEMKDPYIYTEEKTMQKLGLSSPKTFNNSYHLNRQIVEFEYRPTIPFTNLDECTTWCQDYLKDEPNNSDIFFELCELTKQCWSGNPNKRPTITEVIEKLTNLENELSKRR